MSDVVIQVEHLSKLYHIGRAHAKRRHDTLRDPIAECGVRIAEGGVRTADWGLR